MKQQIRNSCFVIPGHKFGTISQGAFALKDVLHGPTKDFRMLVNEIEDAAVMLFVSAVLRTTDRPAAPPGRA